MKYLMIVLVFAAFVSTTGCTNTNEPAIELGNNVVAVVATPTKQAPQTIEHAGFNPNSEFSQNLAIWRKNQHRSYSYRYNQTGFSPAVDVSVTVVDGVVTHVENIGGVKLDVEFGFTMGELIARISNQMRDENATVSVSYDSRGFPQTAYFDQDEQGNGFDITDFKFVDAPVQMARVDLNG